MGYEPRKYWDRRYARDAVGRKGVDDAVVTQQGDIFAATILGMLPFSAVRTLDFGCGVGRLFDDLTVQSKVCFGVDLCKEAVTMARIRHSSPSFFHLKGDFIPFPDGFFDCVVACTVLQHIVDPAQFDLWCQEINRVLVVGGCVVVIDDNNTGKSASHVEFRRPREVAEMLGVLIEEDTVFAHRFSTFSSSHWAFRGRKPGT